MASLHPIERGMALFRELLLSDPATAADYEASRPDFFGPVDPRATPEGAALRMAERRHLEWYCLERTSPALGDLPLEALLERWRERADPEERLCVDALRQSLTGVFEVRDVDPGRGLWLHDLLGLGEYPVAEAEASLALREGDVLAGRIFPLGDQQFRLSPAVAVFRNPALLAALRRDLSGARQGRRGTLRIHQREIERMFFHQGEGAHSHVPETAEVEALGEGDGVGRAPRDEAPKELEAALLEGGLDPEETHALLARMAAYAAVGDAARDEARRFLGALLERAAFDTELDLVRLTELAHEALSALAVRAARARAQQAATEGEGAQAAAGPAAREPRERESGSQASGGAPPQPNRSMRQVSTGEEGSDRGADPRRVADALAAFDAARSSGADLEQLFAQLERDLGLDEEPEDDPGEAPDFPGVLGAVVQEFLWEVGLVEGEPAALSHRGLLRLASFGEQIGVFENFGPEHLLDFATRWSIERGELHSPRQAQSLLESLEKFCRWVEEQHQSPLWTLFQRTHGELLDSLPRVVGANDALGPSARASALGLELASLGRLPGGELGLSSPAGEWLLVRAPKAVLDRLESGDWVRWRQRGGAAEVLLAYPPQSGALWTEDEAGP